MPLPVFFTVYRTGEFTLAVGIQIEGTKKPPVGGFTTLLIALIILVFPMVPGAGLEPAQRERRGILNPLCLPIPPSGLGKNWRRVRSRTGLDGFAIRYITALLTRQIFLTFQPAFALRQCF